MITAIRAALFCGCATVAALVWLGIVALVPLTPNGFFAVSVGLCAVLLACIIGFLVTGLPYLRILFVALILVLAGAYLTNSGALILEGCSISPVEIMKPC